MYGVSFRKEREKRGGKNWGDSQTVRQVCHFKETPVDEKKDMQHVDIAVIGKTNVQVWICFE